jgi:hypothetical protein
MSVLRSFWAHVQGSPTFMRRLNGWLTVFWVVMIPVSIVTGWVRSVVYVSALSLWALVSGHWATWQAARVEVEQQREADELAADPVEERVVRLLAERFGLTAADAVGDAHQEAAATLGAPRSQARSTFGTVTSSVRSR